MSDEGLSVTGRRMVGYALKWDSTAFIRSGRSTFSEQIKRGAFEKPIAAGGVLLCSNHDRTAIVARQSNDTLLLVEDDVGLRVDAWAMATPAGDDAIHDARCRARAGLSVCFTARAVDWVDGKDGRTRIISEADLHEVSVVRDPAYQSSELYAGLMRIEAFERAYQHGGLSFAH